ncbi:MAG: hypothetical protein RID25_23380 [Cyclobacteriaceae bacterium]
MTTNFFTQLEQHLTSSDVVLQAHKADDKIVVIFRIIPKISDPSTKAIPPLKFEGTAECLDNDFFENASQPFELIHNYTNELSEWAKGVEKAKKQSEMAKAKQNELNKLTSGADKKLTKANQALTIKDYTNALKYCSQALKIAPDYKKAIDLNEKAKQESGLFSQPEIFESPK